MSIPTNNGVVTVITEAHAVHTAVNPPARIIEVAKVVGPPGKDGPPGKEGPPGPGFDDTTDFTLYYDLAKGYTP